MFQRWLAPVKSVCIWHRCETCISCEIRSKIGDRLKFLLNCLLGTVLISSRKCVATPSGAIYANGCLIELVFECVLQLFSCLLVTKYLAFDFQTVNLQKLGSCPLTSISYSRVHFSQLSVSKFWWLNCRLYAMFKVSVFYVSVDWT